MSHLLVLGLEEEAMDLGKGSAMDWEWDLDYQSKNFSGLQARNFSRKHTKPK